MSCSLSFFAVLGGRVKRQETDEEELERQLCEGKGAGEWFRLETGKDKCRDVIQCTASVRDDLSRGRSSGSFILFAS